MNQMLSIISLNGKYMKNLATFLIVAVLLGMWGYYFYRQDKLPYLSKVPSTVIPTPTDNIPVYPSVTMSITKFSPTDDSIQIKNSFAKKYGKKVDDIDLNLSQDDGTYATGTVNFKLSMEGGLFIAAKASDEWVIVFDGNGTIPCNVLSSYDFPKSMVPECLNSQGKLVKI